VGVDLEEATTVICDCCDEESARVGGSRRVRHLGILANFFSGRLWLQLGIKTAYKSLSPGSFSGGAKEGSSVVSAAPPLRPSAERYARSRGFFVARLKPGPSGFVPTLCVWVS